MFGLVEKVKNDKESEPAEIKAVNETVPPVPKIVEVRSPALDKWKPKTQLGRDVFEGRITDIHEILRSGKQIKESEIVDKLVPDLKNELILVGGRTGKGGGIQRIPVRITAAMHKSGRRFSYSSFVVIGNENGLVGIGLGKAPETRHAIEKAIKRAKFNLMSVRRGCGSWECEDKSEHSIPFKVEGKSGSVRVILIPAPRGVGLVTNDEAKKIFRLAGIKDVWLKTFGNTGMRINLISAMFDALKKIYTYDRKDRK